MIAVNQSAKTLSSAVAAHNSGAYLGIDKSVYDFVAGLYARECMSITPLQDAIRDNEIHIEQTCCYVHSYPIGQYLRVVTEYKASDLKTARLYAKEMVAS